MARVVLLIRQKVRQSRIGINWTLRSVRNGLWIMGQCPGKAESRVSPPLVALIRILVVNGPPRARLTQLNDLFKLRLVPLAIRMKQPTGNLLGRVDWKQYSLAGVLVWW